MQIYKILLISFIYIVCSGNIDCDLPEPYKNINILPLKAWDSWFINQKPLLRLIERYNPNIVVELGSWLGASTTFMAKNSNASCHIYAVDIWSETKQCAESIKFSKDEPRIFFDEIYQQFLSNIIHLGLTDKIIPIRMDTLEAARCLNIQPDLVYVDASHETDAVYNDIKFWYVKLQANGIMCGDDWGWPSVQEGVKKIANELGQKISFAVNMWWFEPK